MSDVSDELETIGIKDVVDMKDEVVKSEAWRFYESSVCINEEKRYEVRPPGLDSSENLTFKDWLKSGIINRRSNGCGS